jgi:hypothetical protein
MDTVAAMDTVVDGAAFAQDMAADIAVAMLAMLADTQVAATLVDTQAVAMLAGLPAGTVVAADSTAVAGAIGKLQ